MISEDHGKVVALREVVPATSAGIYLDAAAFGPLPAETAAAMRQADDWELRVGRATVGRDEDLDQRIEEARAVLAALVVGDPSQIVLTPGVEHALALAERITGSDMSIVEHVDPNTGAVNPVGGGAVALDATLSAGAIPLDAGALGADFIAIPGDRWLMGPEGTAALWIGPRWADRAHVPAASGLGRTALLGLARSVGWLEMYVGLEWAYSRTAKLVRRLLGSVSSIPRVSVATPAESPAAMVCFAVERWPVEEVLDELRRRVFAIVGSTPDGQRVRASVGWWNTEDEIDRFCGAVTEIAQNTPDSIPRRLPLLGQS